MHQQLLRVITVSMILLLIGTGAVLAQDDDGGAVLPITEDVVYTVRTADTVDFIGALFDVSPTCIAETNELNANNTIFVGDELLISVSCPRYGEDARDEGLLEVQIPREVVLYEEECEGYVVQQLDTLDVIGQTLDVSVQSIQLANDLFDDVTLQVGECLEIPENAPPYGEYPALDVDTELDPTLGSGGPVVGGEFYVVQPNDTLDVIAQEKDVSVVSLRLANNLAPGGILQPGMTLVIPADAPPYGTYPAIMEVEASDEIYLVRSGDTLDSIAEDLDVAILALEIANAIDSEEDIFPGRSLIIPANALGYGEDEQMLGMGGGGTGGAEVTTHVVQPGDTLDVIAAFYDRDVTCLVEANEITRPGAIMPGQVLLIDEDCGPYIGDTIPPVNFSVVPANTGDEAMDAETDTETDEGE